MGRLEGRQAEYFLNSGELLFSTEGCIVWTILGSCVGVAIHDPVLRIGGLCHYLLPGSSGDQPSTKYGDVALPYLLGKFRKAGSSLQDLRAWVVGGAILLDAQEIFFVGDRNAEFAERYLGDHGVRVVDNQTRGYRGRKVVFQTQLGRFQASLIPPQAVRNLLII